MSNPLNNDLVVRLQGGAIAKGAMLRPLVLHLSEKIAEQKHRIEFVTDVVNAVNQFELQSIEPEHRLAILASAIEETAQKTPAYLPFAQACLSNSHARAAYA